MLLKSNVVAIGIISAILIMIVLPINLHLQIIPYFDKFAHFGATGLMTLLLLRFTSIRKAVLITFLLFTGAEWLQYYLPNRGASLGDFLANTAGIFTAWTLYALFPYYLFFYKMKQMGYSRTATLHAIKFFRLYKRVHPG